MAADRLRLRGTSRPRIGAICLMMSPALIFAVRSAVTAINSATLRWPKSEQIGSACPK